MPETVAPAPCLLDCSSLVELLRRYADDCGDRPAYRFLEFDGLEPIEASIRYDELDRAARAIASLLQSHCEPGSRALLAFPPGLDYLKAFLGCLYAGVVAVPAYPPLGARSLVRLASIAEDCGAEVGLTIEPLRALLEQARSPSQADLRWLATDQELRGLDHLWKEPPLDRGTLAYLQYTSGSTGSPKGVLITHSNVIAVLEGINRAFGFSLEDQHVSWAPPYHDLGLVAGILLPIYSGGRPGIGLSAASFLEDPLRWLRVLSQTGGSVSGGPNFAFELCIRKVRPEDRAKLDLSRWTFAYSGGEPVRADTVERFCEAFGPSGFRREAFAPCYGSAEATVCVTGAWPRRAPRVLSFEREAYASGRLVPTEAAGAVRCVSNGPVLDRHEVLIVEPETRTLLGPGEVGELWIHGPVVTSGYWGREDHSREVCRAVLARPDERSRHPGPFLRTGDLGFFHDGEIYISGRSKDVLIIHGKNHHPQDIELTVANCHPAFRPGCTAVFSIDDGSSEHVAVVQEVRRQPFDPEKAFQSIRSAVLRDHGISVSAISLIEPGSLPKTTSGKVSRSPCRTALLQGELDERAEWRVSTTGP